MRTLIQNVAALALDREGQLLYDVDIAVEGKTLAAVGQAPPGFAPDEIIDGRGRVALPAFFNAHCHAPMTLERGWAEDIPFDRWLNEKIWVAESALTEEDVYWGAALAACEMIRAGCVGLADHYFWMDQVARCAQNSGMKAVLAWCQFGLPPEQEVGGASLERTLEFARDWHGAGDGRLRCVLGPHSPYMCSPQFLRRVVEHAQELGLGIHLHVSESRDQVSNSHKQHGKSPVAHLAELGVFDVPCIAAHCVEVSDDDIAILAAKRVNVAHTPKTYLKLAMGMPPLQKFLDAGINVGLGTDGPASNNDMNLMDVMRVAGLYQKNAQGKPEALPHGQILRLATQASARAMGFENSGALEAGRSADLILFDSDQAHWLPRHDLAATIVYAAQPADITHVMCDGRWLLRDGELLTLDEEKIKREAEARAFRMVKSPMQQMRAYRG